MQIMVEYSLRFFLLLARVVKGFKQRRFESSFVLGEPSQECFLAAVIPSLIDFRIKAFNTGAGRNVEFF